MTIPPPQPSTPRSPSHAAANEVSLQTLPPEIQSRIAQRLPTASLWALAATSPALHHLTQRPELVVPHLAPYARADRLGTDICTKVRKVGVAPFESPLGQTFQRQVLQRYGALMLGLSLPIVGGLGRLLAGTWMAPVTVAWAVSAAILAYPYAVPPAVLGLAALKGGILSWPCAAALGLGVWCHGPLVRARWHARRDRSATAADACQAENLRLVSKALADLYGNASNPTDTTCRKALAVTVGLRTSLRRTLPHLERLNDNADIGKILVLVDDPALRAALKPAIELHLCVLDERVLRMMAKLMSRQPGLFEESLRGKFKETEEFLACVKLPSQESAQLNWKTEEVYQAMAPLITPQSFPYLHRHLGWAACRLFENTAPTSAASAIRLLQWLKRPDLVRDTEERSVFQSIAQVRQRNLERGIFDVDLDANLTALEDRLRTIEREAQQAPGEDARDRDALATPPPASSTR